MRLRLRATMRSTSPAIRSDATSCSSDTNGVGQLVVASRAVQAWRHGVSLSSLRSCPPGHVIAVSPEGIRDMGGADIANTPAATALDVDAFREQVREALDQAFSWLAHAFGDRRFAVCLSGGLDSSVVASLASRPSARHGRGKLHLSRYRGPAIATRSARRPTGSPVHRTIFAAPHGSRKRWDFRSCPSCGPAKRWRARLRPRCGFARIGGISTFTARRSICFWPRIFAPPFRARRLSS